MAEEGGILEFVKARRREPDGVSPSGKGSQGTDMNSGEPKYPQQTEFWDALTSPIGQGEAEDVSAVGLAHSTDEARETGRREGAGSSAMSGKETPAIHRDGVWVETRLKLITKMAQGNPKMKFTSLAYLLNEGFLEQCFRGLKRNVACGVDGVSQEEYREGLGDRLKGLAERMKAKRYYPQPLLRVKIPKENGKLRPLGMPTVEDKVAQMGIKRILEVIFEADFLECSYGFRPARSGHDALKVLDKTVMKQPINAVVDMDIEGFFDAIDHKWMMECLKQRIKDPSLLSLVARFLKSGVMEEGKYQNVDMGAPQGGVLSPLLANVYLHFVLDIWFERIVRKQMRGYAKLIRYADDFVVCFQYKEDAMKFEKMLKGRLAKFGLKVAPGKSRVIAFGRRAWKKAKKEGGHVATFDFLGFTHYCETSRRGFFKLGRKTSRKKFRQKLVAMNEWLRGIRSTMKLQVWWGVLKAKLEGHYRYYGVSGNIRSLRKFHWRVSELTFKWLNRRSQRKSYTYDRYNRHLRPTLPLPRIYYNLYAFSAV
jgi:RNA-directed DNA polymerase